uniref:C6 domain-containing protein n=1 Tax=Parastrongyloides trichosuri TaxID=131310 RepID=A0A0N4ZJG2_PARTI
MIYHNISLLLIVAIVAVFYEVTKACVPVITVPPPTTTTVCCTPITIASHPRVAAPAGTPAANLDECAMLRRSSGAVCPVTGTLTCTRATGTTTSEVMLQLLNGNVLVRNFQGTGSSISATVNCVNGVWTTTNSAGVVTPFTQISCSQLTTSGGDTIETVP